MIMLVLNVPRLLLYLCTQRIRLVFLLAARLLLLVDGQSTVQCLVACIRRWMLQVCLLFTGGFMRTLNSFGRYFGR